MKPTNCSPSRNRAHFRRRLRPALLLLIAALHDPATVSACGPFFPNNLLDRGDDAVLVAPVTDFIAELERMKLVESRFQAIPADGHDTPIAYARQSAETELTDLAAALKKGKVPDDEAGRIRSAHEAARAQLNKFLADTVAWNNSRPWVWDQTGEHRGKPQLPQPTFPRIEPAPGLPGEFADYFEGALAWHNPAPGSKDLARAAWERLLARPPQERRYKSTWAAFMLGKACDEAEPDKALGYLQQVRDLARRGFADSSGLAAASLGLEARICLKQHKYDCAIELYLEQLTTGDGTAGVSLVWTAAEVMRQGPAVLRPLAANPRAQRVITAFIISRRYQQWSDREAEASDAGNRPGLAKNASRTWLEAVEAAGVNDMESAAKLALAAYQNNDMAVAWRWIQRAPNSLVGRWLHAKLLLRSGKAAAAAELLAGVAHAFPIQPPDTNRPANARFQDLLSVETSGYYPELIPAERQLLGELGVFRLARREYTQALDALLNAGFWMDAAYVAERVLTTDELKNYVDSYWPPASPEQLAAETEKYGESPISPARLRQDIRYLLARRLVRAHRGDEARDYYPPEWKPQYLVLTQALRAGWDESLPADRRAAALFQAAVILRTNGLELIGTEVAPDWHVHAGDYEEGVTTSGRATNEAARVLVASQDEIQRAAQHVPEPEERFHYRYQAASLAWEAARLMPDNADETARVLCIGGSWLKNRDPDAADLFYKALVRRNRKTALGMEADRLRWFPKLDEQGNLILRGPSAPAPADSPSPPEGALPRASPGNHPRPGQAYVIRSGDSLAWIARDVNAIDRSITLRAILEANPGIEAARLRVGQVINIPAGKTGDDTRPAPEDSTPAPGLPPHPLPGQEPPAEPQP